MTTARKVFTEAMIRKTLKSHEALEEGCSCGWIWPTNSVQLNQAEAWFSKAFEDHFIDQLHKLWHEMFSRPKSTPTATVLAQDNYLEADGT